MHVSQIMTKRHMPPKIPLVVPPRSYENLQGYILRLTELNHYERPWWVYKLLEVSNTDLSFAAFRSYAETLPQLVGLDASVIRKIIYLSEDTSNYNKIHVGDRGVVSAGMMDIVHPRICPECVVEYGAACALWDFKYYQVCTRHRRYLIDRCPNPECGRKLTWWRAYLSKCGKCERPYNQSSSMPQLGKYLWEFSALLEKQWCMPFETNDFKLDGPLANLDFNEFYSLIFMLKNRFSGNFPINSKKPRRGAKAMARLMAGCFIDWPAGYYNYIEAVIGTDMREGRGFSITNTSLFGSFFHRVMQGGEQSYFEPLKHELLEYVHGSKFGAKVTGKGGNRLAKVSSTQKHHMTRTEVMKELQISAATFRKLFAKGQLTGEKLQMGRQHVYRVNLESVETYKESGLRA